MKKYAILHDVKVEQIPVEWVKKLGLDTASLPANTRYEVVFNLVNDSKRGKASYKQFMETVGRLQNVPIVNPDFTEDDLYDEQGLPK